MKLSAGIHLKVLWVLTGVLALLVLLGACAGAEPTATPTPTQAVVATPTRSPTPIQIAGPAGKIVIAQEGLARELFEPRNTPGGQDKTYNVMLHANLVEGEKGSVLLPGIAESWKLTPDGKGWIFTIRDGAKFHDGKPITVDDVVWTMRQMTRSDSGLSLAVNIGLNTEKIEATGPREMTWSVKNPAADLPFNLSVVHPSFSLGGILPKEYGGKSVAEWEQRPISSGPFRFLEHKSGESMRFEAWPDYYMKDRVPKVKEVELRIIPELSSRVAAVQAGQVDMAPASLAMKEQIERGGGWTKSVPEASYGVLWIIIRNLEGPHPLKDARVRLAMELAMDRQALAQQLYKGEAGVISYSGVCPSTMGNAPSLAPRKPDIPRAKQLMKDAGYETGFPLKILTWESSGMPFLPQQAEILADAWEKNLGIKGTIEVGDATAIRDRIQKDLVNGTILVRDNECRLDTMSVEVLAYGNTGFYRASDPGLLAAAREAMGVLDPAQRPAAYTKFYQKAYAEDTNYQPGTVYVNLMFALSKRITNWEPWAMHPYASALWTVRLGQ